MLCLEAVQDGLEDGVGVVGASSIGCAHRVDDVVSRVLRDAADVLQGLVRCVLSAVPFAFLGCGCYAKGAPFLKLAAAGGEERAEVAVLLLCLWRAGVF